MGEMSGLMSDYMCAARKGRSLDSDKIETINNKIMQSARRGENIIKHFNRFAHSADDPVKVIDLGELLDNLVVLSRRFASRKEIELETRFPQVPVCLNTDPFSLQHSVFICIEAAVSAAGEHETITVALEKDDSVCRITVRSGAPFPATDEVKERIPLLKVIMEYLGGRFELVKEQDKIREIILIIPDLP